MLTTTIENIKFRLPDFIIPGAAKSGTTTLYRNLDRHPGLFFPKNRKEPFYFSFGGKKPEYGDPGFVDHIVWKTEDYLPLYTDASADQLTGDASTSYLYTATDTVANMRALYGDQLRDVKVIILLRNPVQRAYSHYTYLVRNGFETRSFAEAISPEGIEEWRKKRWGFDYLRYSLYADAVETFLRNFDHVMVRLTEDLKSPEVYDEIFSFLGVESVEVGEDVRANPSGIPKSRLAVDLMRKNKLLKNAVNLLPEATKKKLLDRRDKLMSKLLTKEPMDAAIAERLTEFFSADIEKLEKAISRDLSHWKATKPLSK